MSAGLVASSMLWQPSRQQAYCRRPMLPTERSWSVARWPDERTHRTSGRHDSPPVWRDEALQRRQSGSPKGARRWTAREQVGEVLGRADWCRWKYLDPQYRAGRSARIGGSQETLRYWARLGAERFPDPARENPAAFHPLYCPPHWGLLRHYFAMTQHFLRAARQAGTCTASAKNIESESGGKKNFVIAKRVADNDGVTWALRSPGCRSHRALIKCGAVAGR